MTVQIRTLPDDEVIKLLALPPREEDIMDKCLAASNVVWVGLVDDKMVCAWGVIPPSLLSNQAYLWLYATEAAKEHAFLFVRHSQVVIKELLTQFDIIHGHCVIGTNYNMKWLKWLGATFGKPEGKLIPFTIRKKKNG